MNVEREPCETTWQKKKKQELFGRNWCVDPKVRWVRTDVSLAA